MEEDVEILPMRQDSSKSLNAAQIDCQSGRNSVLHRHEDHQRHKVVTLESLIL